MKQSCPSDDIDVTLACKNWKSKFKEVRSKLQLGKTSNFQKVTAIVEKLGDEHADVISQECVRVTVLMGRTQVAVQTCNALTGDTYKAEYKKAVEMMESVSKSDQVLGQVVAKLKEVRASEVKSLCADARDTALKVRRLFKQHPLQGQSCPATCIRWLGQGCRRGLTLLLRGPQKARRVSRLTQPRT